VPERVRVQREGAQLRAQGTWSAGEGDGKQQFLADLRRLRDAAALEFEELAARAHYPSDVLKEAESGPGLPTLPILAAYVRACDGEVPEWEERWRRLGLEADGDPGLPVRAAGASAAAVAGARAGVSVAPPDAYDPELIRAALRGSHHERSRGTARPASRRAEPETPAPDSLSGRASWDAAASTGWGTDAPTSRDGFQADAGARWDGFRSNAGARWDDAAPDLSDAPSNGNHYASQPGDESSDPSAIETVNAAQAEAIRRDPFSADWLQGSELTSSPELESGGQDQAEAEPAPDDWFTPRELADRERTWSAAETEPTPEAADAWFTPREQPDDGRGLGRPQPAEHDAAPAQEQTLVTGFWTPSNAPGAADKTTPMPVQASAPARPMTEPAAPSRPMVDASRPMAEPPSRPMAEPASALRPMAEAAPPARTIAEPAVPPGPVVPPIGRRADRLYPVRLLMVIVVAALIGSVLVLLLR
jgi:hypothetical protein